MNNKQKKHRLVFEMCHFYPKMSGVEVRDKQVYDIVADDYGIL